MSDRRGSSRTVGCVKQCAVFVRGGLRCFGCQRKLRAPRTDGGRDTVTATIDHWDGDGRNHAAGNLVAACRSCNSYRRWEDDFRIHLVGWRTTPAAAEARALAQLAQPLDYKAGRALAQKWHPGRLEQLRRDDQRYRQRKRGLIPPAHAFDVAALVRPGSTKEQAA